MVRVLDTGIDAKFQDAVGPYPINFFQGAATPVGCAPIHALSVLQPIHTIQIC